MSLSEEGLHTESRGDRRFALPLLLSSLFSSLFSTEGDKQLLELPALSLHTGERGGELLLWSLSLQLRHRIGCCFFTSCLFSSLMDSAESEDSSASSGVLSAGELTYTIKIQLSKEEESLSFGSAFACNRICRSVLFAAEFSSELSDVSRGEAMFRGISPKME